MAWLMQYTSQAAKKNRYLGPTEAVNEFIKWRKKASEKDLKRMFLMTFLPKEYQD